MGLPQKGPEETYANRIKFGYRKRRKEQSDQYTQTILIIIMIIITIIRK